MSLAVHAVPCLSDNYAWLVVDEPHKAAAVVDPSESEPVETALLERGLRLVEIWNTHHHWDHVGGNEALCQTRPDLVVRGGQVDEGRIAKLNAPMREGDTFSFGGEAVQVLFIPGHTRGHIAFVTAGHVFCGDTLFGAGCGRLFEGTPEQMVASLSKLRDLPDDTQVCCGHEYTLANLRFAVTVDPRNAALARRLEAVMANPGVPTVPFSLGEDKATNPFLRFDAKDVQASAGSTDPVETFATIRKRKDVWRG